VKNNIDNNNDIDYIVKWWVWSGREGSAGFGALRSVPARFCRFGVVWYGVVGLVPVGVVMQVRCGGVWWGGVRSGEVPQVGFGEVRSGEVGFGFAGKVRYGKVQYGKAGSGEVPQVRCGAVW